MVYKIIIKIITIYRVSLINRLEKKTLVGIWWLHGMCVVSRYEFKNDNNVIHSSCIIMCYKYDATADLFAKLYSIKYK